VVKTITVTNDTMLVSLAMVSRAWLDKLPPDLRQDGGGGGQRDAGAPPQMGAGVLKDAEAKWKEMGRPDAHAAAGGPGKMKTLLASVGDDVSKDQPAVLDMLKKVRAVAAQALIPAEPSAFASRALSPCGRGQRLRVQRAGLG